MRAYLLLVLASCADPASVPSFDAGADGSATADGVADASADGSASPDATPDVGEVGFAAQIQPIFDDRCADSRCHDSVAPARGLDLSSAYVSTAEMVLVASSQCPSVALVAPDLPDESYLVWKLEGAGPCFAGQRMPRGTSPLSTFEVALVRAWIAQGALDN